MKKRSPSRLATSLQLERVELLMRGFHGRTPVHVGRAAVKVGDRGMDGRELQACRRWDLRRSVTKSQIHVSYTRADNLLLPAASI